jgi:LacI family transcriptional regulator
MSDKARIIDIAKALNISIATVSRALNNKSDVSLKTKESVLKLAKQLDYKPNNLAISLRKKKSFKSIGVILPNVGHYFFSTVLKGIMNNAHLKNHLVIVGESAESESEEYKLVEEFVNYGVNGILMAPGRESKHEQITELLKTKRIPLILMDRIFPEYNGHYVLSNDRQGAEIATTHLIQKGNKRIAHIGTLDNCSVGHQRYAGYLAALKKYDIKEDESLVQKFEITNVEAGYTATKRLFALENPPDAIFAITDDVAAGAIDFCNDNNINVPKELAIIGFSNSELSSIVKPKLTTIEQNGERMGELAFDYFFQSYKDKQTVRQKIFESKLIVRESCDKLNSNYSMRSSL